MRPRRALFFLFVALLLAGAGPTLAWAQPTHATHSRIASTKTLQQSPSPEPKASPSSHPAEGPPGEGGECQGVQACCAPAMTFNKLICGAAGKNGAHGNGQRHQKEHGGWGPIEYLTLALVALTGFLVLFTFGLVVVGFLQRQTLAESVALTRTVERAWVLVEAASRFEGWNAQTTVIENGESGIRPRLNYTISNDGHSPAWIVRQRIGLVQVDEPPPVPDYSRTKEMAPRPLPPGAKRSQVSDCFVEARQSVAVEPGKAVMMFYGLIEYRDPHQRPEDPSHETGFCVVYKRPTIQFVNEDGVRYEAVRWHIENGPASYIRNT